MQTGWKKILNATQNIEIINLKMILNKIIFLQSHSAGNIGRTETTKSSSRRGYVSGNVQQCKYNVLHLFENALYVKIKYQTPLSY